jgi:hypothetical protein
MLALALTLQLLDVVPPPPPGARIVERVVEIKVETSPSPDVERQLVFVVSVKNTERRAYCIPRSYVPDYPRDGQRPVFVLDAKGDVIDMVEPYHEPEVGEADTLVAIRPMQELRRVIYAGNDYRFPPERHEYVAVVGMGGFYCDELNAGRSRTPLVFKGRSKPFQM